MHLPCVRRLRQSPPQDGMDYAVALVEGRPDFVGNCFQFRTHLLVNDQSNCTTESPLCGAGIGERRMYGRVVEGILQAEWI